MLTVKFLKDAAERVIATFAQALLATGVVLRGGWGVNLKVAGGAALVSLLKSVAASRIGDGDSATLVP